MLKNTTASQYRAQSHIDLNDTRPIHCKMVSPIGDFVLPEGTDAMSLEELRAYVFKTMFVELKSEQKPITDFLTMVFNMVTDHNGERGDACRVYITQTNIPAKWFIVAMQYQWGETRIFEHPLYVYGSGYAG